MDMLDPALDSNSQDKNASPSSEDAHMHTEDGTVEQEDEVPTISNVSGTASLIDPSTGVQYQFRAENGTGGAVTYRVIQMAPGSESGDTPSAQVITSAFGGAQGAVQVVASPFSNGDTSPSADSQSGEPRFTYFTGGNDAGGEGQFYVMMSPQDVLGTGQRQIAPRTQFTPKVEGARTTRDERRRATHNEVERRRRDKINNWIIKLAKIIPDCQSETTKHGQISKVNKGSKSNTDADVLSDNLNAQSKGGILAKACDYIQELRSSNQRLAESAKENESLCVDVELLRQQVEELKNENTILRAQMEQHGIVIEMATSPS